MQNVAGGARRVVVLGEVLWDVFPASIRLGGAPLNFAAHATRLGYDAALISAVGNDELGVKATEAVALLGLDTELIEVSSRFATGKACVAIGPGEETTFTILRPAAYDDVSLSDPQLNSLTGIAPACVYYGTLFPSTARGRATLLRLLAAVPDACRFYDLNLRPGCDSHELVNELLQHANVVKLNETELDTVRQYTGLPADTESFCRAGIARYGWEAACITLGANGCAMLAQGEYVESDGYPVNVADPVGAGDAFAAALMHGLQCQWPTHKIAVFANRLGATVASRAGAIPDWTFDELVGA